MAKRSKYASRAVAVRKKTSWWTKKKIIGASILGVAALAFLIFVVLVFVLDIGPLRPIKSTDEEAAVVGECAGYDVRYEELRYITLINKSALDKELGRYDTLDADGKKEYEEQLEERVLEDLENVYSVLSLCDVLGIDTDSKEVNDTVQAELEEMVDEGFGGSKKAYRDWLESGNLTDAFFRLVVKADVLEHMALNHIVENKIGVEYNTLEDGEFLKYVMESGDFVRTIHAYYPKEWANDPDYDALADAKEDEKKLAAATNRKERLSVMNSCIGAAPFDPNFSIYGDGIYFTYGQMGEEYEEAAFALDEYEVSDAFEMDDGYYVVMRLPLDREDVAFQASTLLKYYQYGVLYDAIDAEKEKISFSGNEYFESLDLIDIK